MLRQAVARTAAACLVLLPRAGDLGAQQSPEVVAIEFDGRHALEAEVLADAIVTRASSCRSTLSSPLCLLGVDRFRRIAGLDSTEARRDAERIATLYEIHGFPGTRVATAIHTDGDRAHVVFDIEEAVPFRVAALRVEGLPPGLEPPPLPLAVGDPYALPALEAAIERLEFHLARHGHPWAAVEIGGSVDEAARSADLVLRVDAGRPVRFGAVSLNLGEPLDRRMILERLAFEPGQRFDPLLLEETERRLYDLDAVGRAVVRVGPHGPGAAEIPVVVDVTPRALLGLELETTLSTTECLELAALGEHRHVGGRPRVLRAGAAVSNLLGEPLGGFPCTDAGRGPYGRADHHAFVSLDEPIPGTASTWLRLELFSERRSEAQVFVERGLGASLRLSHQPNPDLGLVLEYRPQRYRFDAAESYLCGNYGACEPDATVRLSGPAADAPLSAMVVWRSDGELEGVTRDKLDLWRLEPLPRLRAELRLGLDAAGGWSLSEFEYSRARAHASLTRRFGDAFEVAGRVGAGVVLGDDVLPPRVRLFSGGPNSVRGASQNLLGPAVLATDAANIDDLGCAPTAGGCPAVHPEGARLRPLGGSTALEAGFEARWAFAERAQAAAFVDFGRVTAREGSAGRSDWMISPGIGVRLVANIGAIRLDLAFDPRGARTLPLHSFGPDGGIIQLGDVRYDPFGYDRSSLAEEIWRRLQLHVAVGQAF